MTDTQAPSPAPPRRDADDLANAIESSTVRILGGPGIGQWQLADDGKALIVKALRALAVSETVPTEYVCPKCGVMVRHECGRAGDFF